MADSSTVADAPQALPLNVVSNQAAADSIVRRRMWWSMGAGVIPIPMADIAIVAVMQYSMLKDIARVYGVEWHQSRVKAIVGALLGSIVPTRLAHGKATFALQFVPIVGSVAILLSEPLLCGACTYAVGKVFVQHFAAGGTFLDFDPKQVAAFFQREFQAGKDLIAGGAGVAGKAAAATAGN